MLLYLSTTLVEVAYRHVFIDFKCYLFYYIVIALIVFDMCRNVHAVIMKSLFLP